jgi:putative PIN family toxin of toxin-antitoxin system
MRVVLDTNVLLSACLKPAGLEARVVEMALGGELQACVTEAVMDEYRDVLLREKFRACRERAESILKAIGRAALPVTPVKTETAALDEDDNRFLECATAAAADYLITGNLRHYPADWPATRIVNARGFFNALGAI